MKHLLKILSYFVIFGCGFCSAMMLSWAMHNQAPQMASYIPLLKPIDFDVKYILPEDRWILNYQVFLSPLDGIDSKRNYILVTLRPIGNIAASEKLTSHSRFFITGLANTNEVIAFSLQPDKILSNPNIEYMHVLEIKEGFLPNSELQLPESARLVSSRATIRKEP